MELKSKASLQILKPIAEVFEAIVEPNHMTQYFISESNGRLESGKMPKKSGRAIAVVHEKRMIHRHRRQRAMTPMVRNR